MTVERAVTVDGVLHGTLSLPAAGFSGDAVLLLPDSGPTDRNGNGPSLRTDCTRMLAHALADLGVAALRIDKRGVGESRAACRAEEALTIQVFVDDACSWMALLRRQPGVRRLFLLGHSKGALIATLAAQRDCPEGVIALAGAGKPAGRLLRRQLADGGLDAVLLAQADACLAQLEAGRPVSAPPELAVLFRPSVQPFLMSWLAYDPAAELAKVAVPVLAVQGSADLQICREDALFLSPGREGGRFAVIEGMNHVLKLAPTDRAGNLATYVDPGLPLAPNLVPAIHAFMGWCRSAIQPSCAFGAIPRPVPTPPAPTR